MTLSKNVTALFLSAFFALLLAFLPNQNVSAHFAVPTPDAVMSSHSETKIKIKIIIVIKWTKKGVAEITDMLLAGNKKSLENNEVLADAYVEGNQLYLSPLRGEAARAQFILPQFFKVNPEVALKLGQKGGMTLKAGKFDFGPNNLGNFEIQD